MKKIYFLLFAILCSVSAHSMNWRQRLSLNLWKMGKGLSIGFPISVGVAKAGARAYVEDDLVKNLESNLQPASPEVASWCHNHLDSCGKELANIPIKIRDRDEYGALSSDDFIAINKPLAKMIMAKEQTRSILNNSLYEDNWRNTLLREDKDNQLASLPVTLRHEIAHVHYHDATLSTALGTIVGSTALMQLAASGMQSLRKPKLPPTTISRGIWALCRGGIAGLTKVYGAQQLVVGYQHYQEYRADKFAWQHTDSIEELESRAKRYDNDHEKFLAAIVGKTAYLEGRDPEKEWRNFKNSPLWMQNMRSKIGFFAVDPIHPHPLKRAERARAAAAKLKQKNLQ